MHAIDVSRLFGSVSWCVLTLALPIVSHAQDIQVADSIEGWATVSSDTNNCCLSSENYFVGSEPEGRPFGGEFRNYFSFDIPDFSGTATSASILIPTAQTLFNQSPSLQYTLTSVSVPLTLVAGVPNSTVFNALGTGVQFGSETYSDEGPFGTVAISLDAAALQAIDSSRGSSFTLGGRVTSPIGFGPGVPDQSIFGSSGGSTPQVQLVFSHSPALRTPEIDPAAWAAPVMLLLGLLAVVGGGRRLRISEVRVDRPQFIHE